MVGDLRPFYVDCAIHEHLPYRARIVYALWMVRRLHSGMVDAVAPLQHPPDAAAFLGSFIRRNRPGARPAGGSSAVSSHAKIEQ
uniref:Transcriptional regulator n=1 Tax=Ascaris lumbricoides TaxID=6252 RepID=A0A0M3HX72_ASCLU